MPQLAFAVALAVFVLPREYHVDCTGWNGAARVEFALRITAMDGTVYKTKVELLPDSTATEARDTLVLALERAGWRVRSVGKGILVLEGSKKSAVRTVEFTSKDWRPDVRMMLLVPEKK